MTAKEVLYVFETTEKKQQGVKFLSFYSQLDGG
jgi:hypothetical protein